MCNAVNFPDFTAIRCDEEKMKSMIPKHASLWKARNLLSEEEFGQPQLNSFNQYKNVITIRCNEAYIYSDRTMERTITCELKNNSDIDSEWRGYGSTILPLPKECERKFVIHFYEMEVT